MIVYLMTMPCHALSNPRHRRAIEEGFQDILTNLAVPSFTGGCVWKVDARKTLSTWCSTKKVLAFNGKEDTNMYEWLQICKKKH